MSLEDRSMLRKFDNWKEFFSFASHCNEFTTNAYDFHLHRIVDEPNDGDYSLLPNSRCTHCHNGGVSFAQFPGGNVAQLIRAHTSFLTMLLVRDYVRTYPDVNLKDAETEISKVFNEGASEVLKELSDVRVCAIIGKDMKFRCSECPQLKECFYFEEQKNSTKNSMKIDYSLKFQHDVLHTNVCDVATCDFPPKAFMICPLILRAAADLHNGSLVDNVWNKPEECDPLTSGVLDTISSVIDDMQSDIIEFKCDYNWLFDLLLLRLSIADNHLNDRQLSEWERYMLTFILDSGYDFEVDVDMYELLEEPLDGVLLCGSSSPDMHVGKPVDLSNFWDDFVRAAVPHITLPRLNIRVVAAYGSVIARIEGLGMEKAEEFRDAILENRELNRVFLQFVGSHLNAPFDGPLTLCTAVPRGRTRGLDALQSPLGRIDGSTFVCAFEVDGIDSGGHNTTWTKIAGSVYRAVDTMIRFDAGQSGDHELPSLVFWYINENWKENLVSAIQGNHQEHRNDDVEAKIKAKRLALACNAKSRDWLHFVEDDNGEMCVEAAKGSNVRFVLLCSICPAFRLAVKHAVTALSALGKVSTQQLKLDVVGLHTESPVAHYVDKR